jgi:cholesterol transport system auxiliary component
MTRQADCHPPLRRRCALLCLLGLGALLSACTTLLGNPQQAPLTSYALEGAAPPVRAASASASAGLPRQRVLLLAQPNAAPGYDSARMVYQRQPQTLEAFTQSTWMDTPARMLAPLLLRSLQDSGLLRAVLQAPSAARADLLLETSILRLQQSFLQQPSSVRFTLQATLTDPLTREVVAWRVLDVTQNADSDDAAGGAAAANVAVQAALQQLLAFVQTSLAALPAPTAPAQGH